MFKPPARERAGFTLIELLVVISIISLLISILLPALGSARKRSAQIKCASNLKHAGSAISMYAMDFNDFFPQADASADFRWYIALPRTGYVNGSQSLMCPEAQNPKESWYGGGKYAPVSYGMNSMIGGLNNVLIGGDPILNLTISLRTVESEIAKSITEIQNKNNEVEIGSYPFFRAGKLGVSIVLRSANKKKLELCNAEILDFVKSKKIEIIEEI